MSEINIQEAWKALNEKAALQSQINAMLTQEIAKGKVHSAIHRLTPIKVFTLIVGVLWMLCLVAITVLAWNIGNWFLLGSFAAIALTNALAIVIYGVQLLWIQTTDWQGPVQATQTRLLQIRTTTLWVAKILFLQTPFWSTFYWTPSLFSNAPWYFLVLQCSLTASLAMASGWLFANIHIENSRKPWFKMIFNGSEWERVQEALDWNKKA